ncbi:NAD-glutamate dehydrogenase domain-containing protein [Hydrogenimonas cancrithermarum]|uniref:NAD-glutamate dehydrogenase n=1 Tax=Hydrogenimonas cancrithermarum TaxID=2993563 RepID=A0ABM8FN72_9BACT|nr:NAD-glutamate dehydrogenase domain-containing protein [Hydrogenimonas cancrithermarum]BDY12834.1 NAD-glutamate dehydrogenase [Hydrogenimonas cancrithermarum]BDY12951.1 NAD-glutamate dehydrogenase [Hydrogenimonas cancrithermarum]
MDLDQRYANTCLQILRSDDLTLPETIEKELSTHPFAAEFIEDENGALYLKIYSTHHFMLTQIVPLLKNIGLAVHSEITYEIPFGEKKISVSRYRIGNERVDDIKRTKKNILELLETMLCHPKLPNTPLLQLTLLENFSPRELELLNALIDFENQLVLSFNRVTITDVLIKHHQITKSLLTYFYLKFNPALKRRKEQMNESEKRIEKMLHPITHITEDMVIRMLFEMIRQMVRTNFFLEKETIAFKTHTDRIQGKLEGIQPHIEAFVHHYRLSGVHLRMGKVSRGGIRWSDRFEDFRVEIHSLMLTQEGKNAVIIPRGAKGGFIIRLPREEIDRNTFKHFYELYIDALLDLVDNQEEGRTIVNPKIVRYDGDDTYLVVAADKGTAHMSDTANAIALKRAFWLGDAFASGGSNGYNHKELGITAKGAMRSVERFFIERGINFYETPITVVGIGSMNGDVFGNGMLLSRHFRLLAAISHNEIFIDPDPDPEISYQERKRLFAASPKGGWRYYDPEKISEGGGVFGRDEKEILLSNAMQKLFRTTRQSMSGEEIVQAVLRLKADMLFNGGVGTYVKASWESNLDVGDKANENVRIDASDLKVHAVCEGGNLGFTLPARIEYAKAGGFINLDAIDNSAGVNTSDYEVNLKITLGALVRKGQLDDKSRLEALQHQAEMVTNRVLWTNYHQSLAISLDYRRSQRDMVPFLQAIALLERELPVFSRKQFHIPKDEKIEQVLDSNQGLVRPLLGTLLSYAKIFLKRQLLESDLLEESFAQEYLLKYFPKTFTTIYEDEILGHPLRREIAATVMANRVVNNAGVTFVSDFDELGNERFVSKVKSYLICNQLFGSNDIRFEIFRHDYAMEAQKQYELLFEIETTLEFSVNWMIRHLSPEQIHAPTLLRYKSELATLMEMTPDENIVPIVNEKSPINRFFHHLPYMKFTVAAIILHEKNHRRFDETAKLMYAIIKELHINEIMEALENYRPKNKEEHTIKKQLEEFIEFAVTSLSEKVIHYQRKNETMEEALKSYLHDCEERYTFLQESFGKFMEQPVIERLEDIAILVNSLIQMTVENPI